MRTFRARPMPTNRVALAWAGIGVLCALVLGGCGASTTRFTDGPVITAVTDTADIPEPSEHVFRRLQHHAENFSSRQLRLRLDPMPPKPAEDVNRLGEVPNSTWYENRIDRLRPQDFAKGPGGDDPGPEPYKPWTVLSWKVGGRNPGFVFADTRGVRYICKFDKPGEPVVATAAGVIANRLLWACGYHAPDDRIVFFQRPDLVLSDELRARAAAGEDVSVTDARIDSSLETYVARMPNGDYRVLVSRFLPGRPRGGFHYRGTRDDDPNDVIPHQRRRSLRGLRVFGAWLNHVDLKIDNTLDLYTEENGRHFLRHYLVDFDGCLGGYWAARKEQRIGFAYDVDLLEFAGGLVRLGLWPRPYERLGEPVHPYLGLIEADVYDPATWKANYLNDYVLAATPADEYWAATVMARIDLPRIAAAVSAARFLDATADSLMIEILAQRWAKTVDWGLSRVTPVMGMENLRMGGSALDIRAEDALVHFGRPSSLRYRIRLLDGSGDVLAGDRDSPGPGVVVPAEVLARTGYLVVRWTATDATGRTLPPSEGHYRRDDRGWRLAGILRDGQ
jgi:hypothetical protein